ncbi:MAG: SDR family oxidoreductase [Acidobacteriota bacterium]
MADIAETRTTERNGSEIAIVGMSCRFPGASTVEELWRNLAGGVESLTLLTDEELARAGVDPALAGNPAYVRRVPVLDNVELFDPAFFGYTPLEAKLMDPQHRLFLECAWEVFEQAGYDPEVYPAPVGVFTGAKTNTYLFSLFSNRELFRSLDNFQIALGNDLAVMATRVSYKLNLRGPSYALHTACSTSLVAVHLACQSLLLGECRMAVAGGAAVNVPQRKGYLPQKGGILSSDGSCRTFDARAEGSNFGNGAGALLLKRLEDAQADGDHVYAVILGSATNNDGARKASYTAPGVEGQTDVLLEAMACAGVDADSLSYIEAHGTATELGDSIEMLALTEAFRAGTDRKGFCAIGSIKTNLGHLETAAGVAGLIKTALALERRQIPPSLHFETPSPRIDLENSPFRVNTGLADWRSADGSPLRAGVSSFGIGSTNAHVILEEPPAPAPTTPSRPWQLLLLSARTGTALDAMTANLAEHFEERTDLDFADAAYTLRVGRRAFQHRRALVCSDSMDAAAALRAGGARLLTADRGTAERSVVFLFPGLGEHYAEMGLGLYRSEPAFRDALDRCAELLRPELGLDLRDAFFPRGADAEETASEAGAKPDFRRLLGRASGRDDEASRLLDQTFLAQPATFAVEYALAQVWLEWGVRPQAMIGYSVGEYVAACLAGVLSLEDALRLVARRARAIQDLPGGAMTAVPLPEVGIAPYLAKHGLSLAALNGPAVSVVSGEVERVEALERELQEQGVVSRRLSATHAFHSAALEPASDTLTALARAARLGAPRIPYVSNVTGTWITDVEATDPAYWARHMCGPVRFADGVGTLLRDGERIFLEVGPGQSLGSFLRLHPDCDRERGRRAFASMRASHDRQPAQAVLLEALGRLWMAGAPVDWEGFHAREQRRRVPLPTYPFERQRYWVEPDGEALGVAPRRGGLEKKPEVRDWFYLPVWNEAELPAPAAGARTEGCWLVLADGGGLGERLAGKLARHGADVVLVRPGESLERAGRGAWTLRPAESEDWQALLRELERSGRRPRRVVHLWSVGEVETDVPDEERFRRAQETGFYSLLALAQAFARHGVNGALRIDVVTSGVQSVTGDEPLAPERSPVLGACRVVPQEHPNVTCRSVDVALEADPEPLADRLLAELLAGPEPLVVAHRGGRRVAEAFEPFPVGPADKPVFREHGVYLITGGVGGIGLVLARHLAREAKARLVLTRRTPVPPREDWGGTALGRVLELEELGAEVLVMSADVADEAAMRAVVDGALERFGALHGVIHAAGVLDPDTFKTVLQTTRAECEAQFHPKVYGLYVLERVLAGIDLDFCLLYSSLSAILGGLGYVGYATANLFMDFFAERHNRAGGAPWLSVDWDSWHYQEASAEEQGKGGIGATLVELAVTPDEGIEAVRRVLALDGVRRIVMSTGELQPRLDQWVQLKAMRAAAETGGADGPRPRLKSTALPSGGELERRIAGVWSRLLGVDEVGSDENFFDLGGNSLLGMQLVAEINRDLGVEITPITLFESPTVGALARQLAPSASEGGDREVRSRRRARRPQRPESQDVAIVGLACRLPGSPDVDSFWRNLRDGRETISFFAEEELIAAGADPADVRSASYVKARPILDGVELFDAPFFGYSARDAELMDPQHRLFLENAWEAVENAGYDPARFDGLVGVYAGASISSYMVNIYSNPELVEEVGTFPILIGNEKDAVTTKVSYKLDLKGPSLAVQTFCSTSLVAVHLACQGLLNGECDMALAGGVSIILPQKSGYHYQEGGIGSVDGHIRAFDAKASGIVFGNGLGVVVLKRLEDALADGDRVHAVIKASAVNNDGSIKAGYTATSVDGQAEVVSAALEISGIHPETIGYMEAHGTGTPLGDPIEMAALTKAFRAYTGERTFCPIGSAKTNVGHLDRAAGVTGLIKAVLALKHRQIPPSLYFDEPNPNIDFEDCPFYVNTELRDWAPDGGPRRAGVNSLGLGGTNAHVILEEAPEVEPSGPSRPWQLLLLSAQTGPALESVTSRLAGHLAGLDGLDDPGLADVAYTLQVGRKPLVWRRMLVCRDREDAMEALQGRHPQRLLSAVEEGKGRPVAFLFPGLGSQYPGMARGLYEEEPVFREEVDRCAELLKPLLGLDLREVIHPAAQAAPLGNSGVDLRQMLRRSSAAEEDEAARRLNETWLTQPALFVIELALARLWMSWGIRPQAMIGYSVGEYVAACLAGVLSVEDALGLVARRARMIQELPAGAMLAVPLAEEQLASRLGGDLSLSAVNGAGQSVVAGPPEAVAALERALAEEGIVCRRLQTSHAFHSRMMDPLFEPLVELVRRVELKPPAIPYLSNVTGTWITDAEATDPSYWARHMCGTVRFAEGVGQLLERPDRLLLEVGPGQTLGSLILQQQVDGARVTVVGSLRHSYETQPDGAHLLGALGRLWLGGVEIDWNGFYARERRLRAELPTYPFERRRYWIEPKDTGYSTSRRMIAEKRGVADWFSIPSWKRTPRPRVAIPETDGGDWLIFTDGDLGDRLADRLRGEGKRVITVRPGDVDARLDGDELAVDPFGPGAYASLVRGLSRVPTRIVYLWSLLAGEADEVERALALGPSGLSALAEALAGAGEPVRLWAVSSGLHDVHGSEEVWPERAAVVGACRSISASHPAIACRSVDLVLSPEAGALDRLAGLLRDELLAERPERSVAYRGDHRWVPLAEPVSPSADGGRLREEGVYLIAGDLEGAGLRFAEHLARTVRARLVLDGAVAEPILERLRSLGGEILPAEVSSGIHGAIYVAPSSGSLASRVGDLRRLDRRLADAGLDWALLVSPRAGGPDAARASASLYLDAFATGGRGAVPWVSVSWDLEKPGAEAAGEALGHLLSLDGLTHVMVSPRPLSDPWETLERPGAGSGSGEATAEPARHPRPDLRVEYVEPRDGTERTIAGIWRELLGLSQVGVYDSFLDLGGDSLLAARLLTKMRDAFDLDLPIRLIFEAATVAELAKVVQQARSEAPDGAEVGLSETELAEMQAMLEEMSDEDVEAELARRAQRETES